eukprot:TRINITY_DN37158_c0_g1_i1.p1 TRINITY_DN37158_c0_g1~~TRINITY_DN37158_c0_g1_i1.p1  ORF type:complete len:102 (+),score=24.68 TRINITY_DN37158_c0_g1_i1:192-497(+)
MTAEDLPVLDRVDFFEVKRSLMTPSLASWSLEAQGGYVKTFSELRDVVAVAVDAITLCLEEHVEEADDRDKILLHRRRLGWKLKKLEKMRCTRFALSLQHA